MSRAETAAALKAHLAQASALADILGVDVPAQPAPVVQPSPVVTAPAPAASSGEPVGPDGAPAFADYGKFYDWLRGNNMLGPTISASEFGGCDAILKACALAASPLAYAAYELATPYLETAHTMQPIDELGGTAYFTRLYDVAGRDPKRARSMGNVNPGDGARFHGRGLVQLTWRVNYEKAKAALGVDFIANPELAKRPDLAAAIMVRGMREGWFTSKKLSDFLPPAGPGDRAAFKAARRIINGQDRADDVAAYSLDFQKALQAGGWRY